MSTPPTSSYLPLSTMNISSFWRKDNMSMSSMTTSLLQEGTDVHEQLL